MGDFPLFERYIGIDYSGAEAPTSRLKGLQVFMATRADEPKRINTPAGDTWNWTRKEMALWCVEDKADTKRIKRAVEGWYCERARETLDRYMEKCHVIASRHGVPEPLLAIRAMRRRWGSCSPAGRITLNLKLVQAPVHCVEYVIMHELCHMKYHDHSKAFYSLLSRCQPDWRKRKEVLNRVRIS